jgi:hypothetical protein
VRAGQLIDHQFGSAAAKLRRVHPPRASRSRSQIQGARYAAWLASCSCTHPQVPVLWRLAQGNQRRNQILLLLHARLCQLMPADRGECPRTRATSELSIARAFSLLEKNGSVVQSFPDCVNRHSTLPTGLGLHRRLSVTLHIFNLYY